MKKKKIILFICIPCIIIISLSYFFFVHKYNVVLVSDNDILEVQAINYNGTVKTPKPPEKENYDFEGWYIGDKKYDFNKPVHKDIKIEAKFRPVLLNLVIDKEKVTLENSETLKLNVSAEPKDAKIGLVTWYSEDSSIVSVSVDGVLTAHKAGTTKIIASSNKKSASVEVTVNKVLAQAVSIKQRDLTINVGDEVVLDATIAPDNTDSKYLYWSVSDSKVLSVTSSGKVKALKAGKSKVLVKTNNDKKDSMDITVKDVYPTNIKVDNIRTTLGKKVKLNVTLSPKNTSVRNVKYTSSDTSVATIDDNGYIVGLKPGKVTVTVTTSNGKISSASATFISKTNNKSALFIGDSITFGRNSTPRGYSWANYIGDNYDLKSITNGGWSGAVISNTSELYLINKMNSYKNHNYDYIILSGGTNDIHYGVALGTFNSNDFSGNYNTKTFLGGLENYIYTAKKNWPNAKIGYIITYETPNSSKNRIKLSSKYYKEMKKVLDKWNIDYLDLYSGSNIYGIKYRNLLKVNSYKYLVDGLHLNREGYNLVSPYVYIWMNTL